MKGKILLILMLTCPLVTSATYPFILNKKTSTTVDTTLIPLGGNAFFNTKGDPKDAIVKEGIQP